MARKSKRNDERMGESMDNSPMRKTRVDRTDRMMTAGARGDHAAGNEGIDDPAMPNTQHDSDRQQGRESTDDNSESFQGQGGQKEGPASGEGTGYTRDSNTDDSDSENPLV